MVSKSDISLVRSLSDKKNRVAQGLFIVEGIKILDEALRSGSEVVRIFGTVEFKHIPGCEIVSDKDIVRMSSLKTPQGIIALIKIPSYTLPETSGNELTLALDGLQDPGNVGTILRIADWFGIRDIICSPDTADCYNPKAVQASMGSVFRIRVHYGELHNTLKEVISKGITVYGASLDGQNIYRSEIKEPEKGIIVIGNEGNGISKEISAIITKKLFIPPYPCESSMVESLNAAVATSIICSEFRRRL